MEFSYDNSDANPRNPSHPPRRVRFGQQSGDEMGELWIQVLTRNSKDRLALERDSQLKTLTEIASYCKFQLQLNPNDAKARCRLGFAWSSLGKRDEAVEELRRAVELDANYDEPHLHLGIIWLNQRQYAQARSEFEVVERWPERWTGRAPPQRFFRVLLAVMNTGNRFCGNGAVTGAFIFRRFWCEVFIEPRRRRVQHVLLCRHGLTGITQDSLDKTAR